ncbi:actin-related protein 2/3 complex subunit 5 [Xylariales sp. AK1849]|nr:actin-related protein 2/3 complex subunit 5 [Xylariales sp. AK1849]
MSIIQQHTSASLSDAWRTINIDALDPDSSQNFDTTTLHPPLPEVTEAEARQLNGQVRQLLRGGDAEGALRGCLEIPVYAGTDGAKEAHMQTVVEVLQSIKASDMTPMLQRIYKSEGGSELLDVLMKYLYKGMSGSASGGAPRTPSRASSSLTPQQTGFSQVGGRPGASNESTGAAMSVLLSWHEKVVDVAGLGSIGRCMTDWRKV